MALIHYQELLLASIVWEAISQGRALGAALSAQVDTTLPKKLQFVLHVRLVLFQGQRNLPAAPLAVLERFQQFMQQLLAFFAQPELTLLQWVVLHVQNAHQALQTQIKAVLHPVFAFLAVPELALYLDHLRAHLVAQAHTPNKTLILA